MITTLSAEVVECLDDCLVDSVSANNITVLLWPQELQKYLYQSESILIDETKLRATMRETVKSNDWLDTPVSVRRLDLSWFYSDRKNFYSLARSLQNQTSRFYTSEFVTYLLELFWAQSKRTILIRHFLPYLMFVIFSILYMYDTLSREKLGFDEETSMAAKVYNKGSGIVTLILLAILICEEIL